jgi:hypothetical protein
MHHFACTLNIQTNAQVSEKIHTHVHILTQITNTVFV